MNVAAKLFRFPAQQNRLHVFLAMVIQMAGVLALATVVRERRPHPATDRATWESMGMFAEFSAIVPLAILLVFAGVAAWHALDGPSTNAARASECTTILKWFAVGVALTSLQLVGYGFWKGIWEFFGPMAGIGPSTLALTFLVLRFADSGDLQQPVRRTARNGPE